MSTEIADHDIRELAYALWQQAGSPEGQEDEFWNHAKDQLLKEQVHADIDAASEESFPASDPVNHM
jgi:hypothetical protein